jgi:hypothetical protein
LKERHCEPCEAYMDFILPLEEILISKKENLEEKLAKICKSQEQLAAAELPERMFKGMLQASALQVSLALA